MLKIRILLYTSLALVSVWLLAGCTTSVDTSYTTRWFYKGDDDPYKSRGSGRTTSSGFTTFKEGK